MLPQLFLLCILSLCLIDGYGQITLHKNYITDREVVFNTCILKTTFYNKHCLSFNRFRFVICDRYWCFCHCQRTWKAFYDLLTVSFKTISLWTLRLWIFIASWLRLITSYIHVQLHGQQVGCLHLLNPYYPPFQLLHTCSSKPLG